MKHRHHIIPRHMDGTDDPSNLVDLTIEEHAEAHKKLYEEYGRWQDYVAWQGLAKLSPKQELVALKLHESGKAGAAKSNIRWKDPAEKKKQSVRMTKYRQENINKTWKGRNYEIINPAGVVEVVVGLSQWCKEHGFNGNTFANACLRGTNTHGGYRIRKI